MREKFARFMAGRNGNDQLNAFLLGVEMVLLLIAVIFTDSIGKYLYVLVLLVLVLVYFRMLSRNVYRRREENERFIRLKYKALAWWRVRRERWVQRKDYKFFTCPSCRAVMRVPRGKGRIKIVCRTCGNSFTGKT